MMTRDLFAVTNLVVVVPMKEMHPGRIQDFTLGRDSAETSKASRPRIEAPSGLDFLKIFFCVELTHFCALLTEVIS